MVGSCATISVGAFYYAKSDVRYSVHQQEAQDSEAVQLAAQVLRERLNSAVGDIEFLHELPRLTGALQRPTPRNIQRLTSDFEAYMQARGGIDQIRWIEEDGRERVRVNYVDGNAVAVPPGKLQNKSRRPYVIEAKKLPPGGLYVSPADLNIEHGRIEIPYKPVIRFAMPIFGPHGHRHGLVVVNFLGKDWFDAFTDAAGKKAVNLMLVNRNGYWMRGPRPRDDWGFSLGKPYTIGRKYATVWKAIKEKSQGYALIATGLWTWTSVDPLKVVQKSLEQDTTNVVRPAITGEYSYQWHALLQLTTRQLDAIHNQVWRSILPVFVLLIFVALLVSVWVTREQVLISRLNRELSKRADAAEAATRAKADFVANMSHEIRTPMNAVVGLSYLLEKTNLTEEARDLVGKLRIAGRSLQGIIDEILDFSKIEAGRVTIESEPFQLIHVLENISTIMSAGAGDKDIELVISPPPHPSDTLRGDALRLEQILINLTSNAIKFTDTGYVRVSISEKANTNTHVTLRFSVIDTGIGIPEDKQQEIFSQFSQADASTTRRFGGTGLGLTICRHLIEMMGGEIGVVSVPGQGSEFWFTLTFERVNTESVQAPMMTGLKVLIADDNPIARHALRDTAVGLGWKVTTVGSGTEAVQQAMDEQPDGDQSSVLILDWKMPDMDGLAVARAIRNAGRNGKRPIILMVSAYLRDSLLESPESRLVDGILSKPVTPSSLYNAVARALRIHSGEVRRAEPLGERLRGIRLLVADDSEINREVAQRIFEDEGAKVIAVDNGEQAVDWIKENPEDVDLVLMDVQMPIMDGYEATRRIRSLPGMEQLPIVALTAGAFRMQQEAAKAAGMVGFIAKPFDVASAINLIQKLTGKGDKLYVDVRASGVIHDQPLGKKFKEEDFPGIAVAQGLARWKDASVYRRYLRKFAREYGNAVEMMLRESPEDSALIAHKMKGASGNLALNQVMSAADAVVLACKAQENMDSSYEKLRQAMNIALESIKRFAQEESGGDDVKMCGDDEDRVEELLGRVLKAFDTRNPDTVEVVLTDLARLLPHDRIEPLFMAIEDFDFQGGRVATLALAEDLGVSLEV